MVDAHILGRALAIFQTQSGKKNLFCRQKKQPQREE